MKKILKNLNINAEQIYYDNYENNDQKNEINFRKQISNKEKIDYFKEISNNHSICVMDNEVIRILKKVPKNGRHYN